jgi:cytidylate kinase
MYRQHQIPLFLILILLAAGCTSRTKEVVKEQYVITDIICDRIDSTDKQPTKEELQGFVIGTKDTFDTLKQKGQDISITVYAKATTLSNRINNKENIDLDELRQFVKMTRDVYKLLLGEEQK